MEEFLKNFALLPRDIVAIPLMAVLFAVFWRIFGSTVIARHLALLEAREMSTVGVTKRADQNLNKAETLTSEYEKKLTIERSAISKSLEPKILAARSEADRIIESAEAEAATLVESTRSAIAEDKKRLAGVLESDADSLASSISERVLA